MPRLNRTAQRGSQKEVLPDLLYYESFDLGAAPDDLMQAIIAETPWRQDEIVLFGRTMRQPRLTAWYGDAGCAYKYSGIRLEPLPWTALLAAVRQRVEAVTGQRFNSVLLNYYRDERDSMGMHSDDEKELGPEPVIASVSLGAARDLLLKSRLERGAKPIKRPLGSGSLLIMRGNTQSNFKHGLARTTQPTGPRINLTFRTIIT